MNAIEKALKMVELAKELVKCADCGKTAFNANGILKDDGYEHLCQKHQQRYNELKKGA